VRIDTVRRTADRPVQHEALRRFGIRVAERERAGRAHAASHHVRRGEAEMIEQRFALRCVVRPTQELDAAARRTRFAPVERDARIL